MWADTACTCVARAWRTGDRVRRRARRILAQLDVRRCPMWRVCARRAARSGGFRVERCAARCRARSRESWRNCGACWPAAAVRRRTCSWGTRSAGSSRGLRAPAPRRGRGARAARSRLPRGLARIPPRRTRCSSAAASSCAATAGIAARFGITRAGGRARRRRRARRRARRRVCREPGPLRRVDEEVLAPVAKLSPDVARDRASGSGPGRSSSKRSAVRSSRSA